MFAHLDPALLAALGYALSGLVLLDILRRARLAGLAR